MPSETRDHLIEHKERTIGMTEPLKVLQVASTGMFGPGRLQNQCCDAAWIFIEQSLRIFDVIVAEAQRKLACRFGDAGVHCRRADEPVIRGEEGMVGTARDEIAACIGASQTHGSGGRIRTVLAELDHLRAVDHMEELFCAGHLDRCRTREVTSIREFALSCLHDRRIGMAKAYGPIAHAVFYVGVAISIPDLGTRAADDKTGRKNRVLVITLRVCVASAWDEFMRAALQNTGSVELAEQLAHQNLLTQLVSQVILCGLSLFLKTAISGGLVPIAHQ